MQASKSCESNQYVVVLKRMQLPLMQANSQDNSKTVERACVATMGQGLRSC